MAWSRAPSPSSASKREASARLRAGAAGLVAVAIGLALLGLHRLAPSRFEALRSVTLDAVTPAWALAQQPVRFVEGAAEEVAGYFDAARQNRELRAEVRGLRARAAEADALEAETLRLKRALRLTGPGRARVAMAYVAAGAGAGPSGTAIITAGSTHGVRVGQPVFTEGGLLGRVIETGGAASRVLLITDGASRVPVRVTRTGAPGLLSGIGDGTAELSLLSDPRIADAVRPGDRVETSGQGGVFPPGAAVAEVTRVERDRALALPLASPATLGLAVVEAIWLPRIEAPAAVPPPPPGDALAAKAGGAAGAAPGAGPPAGPQP